MITISENIADLVDFGLHTAVVLAAQWGILMLGCMSV